MKVLGPNDKIISGLAAATTPLAAADLVPVVQGGTTKKATLSQLSKTLFNASVSTPGAGFASDTYLVGSDLTFVVGQLQAKTLYRALFSVAKTGAGTVAPIIIVRVGTLGTTGDGNRLQFTFPAQTAVIDEGVFTIDAIFRTVGSGTSAVLAGVGRLTHDLGLGTSAATGLSVQAAPTVPTVGSGFDSSTATKIGLSVNGGTSAAWTIAVVQASLLNLA